MPTSTRGGGATVEPPMVPARTTAAPIQPPQSKPVALLQQNGFNGDIQDFNHRIQAVYQAHTQALGYPPSPGLTLAVARNAEPKDYPGLFSRSSHQQTQTQTVLAADQKQNPDDYYTPDAHGFLQPNTPFGRLIAASKPAPVTAAAATTVAPVMLGRAQVRQEVPAPPAKPQPVGPSTAKQDFNTRPAAATPEQLQASHPWVPLQAGFLPIDGFGGFVKAIGTLSQQGQIATKDGQVTVGGQTLAEYKAQVRQSLIEAPVGQQNVPTSELANRSDAITTIKKAQEQLKTNFPAYYDGLSADGNFNQDWVSATAKFQSSELYYRSATDRLAKDNHFDSPAAFESAWNEKQRLIQKHPAYAAALQHQPLAFFGNGKSVLNFIDGDAHGWGFINLPTLALNSVIGVAKTAFSEASAASAYYKANTGFLVNFYHDVLPGWAGGKDMTFDKAHVQATKVLYENPSYLRAFVPDFPAHPTGALAAADWASNLALDLFLGNKLVVGGSAVYAGDVKGLASSRYFNKSSEWAFNAMRQKGLGGVGEASKVLQGGEGLNVAVAEPIKNGEMTLGQFKQHVADLYHHGQTAVGDSILHADATPNSHVLQSLNSLETPNPSLPRQAVKQALDSVDLWAKDASLPGTTRAADALSAARVLFTRAAPQNDVRRIYDTKTPDDIFNWVVATLKDRTLAYKARNDFVVARAHQDIPAIQELNQSLLKRYAAEYPNVKGKPSPLEESLGPQTESESLSNFRFLGGRQKATDGALAAIHRKAQDLNSKLLGLAAIQRQAIIAGEPFPGVPFPGGESLFYKHMVADTARRIAGGGGVSFKLSKEQLAAKREVDDFFFGNPAALRDFSANRAGAEQGEYAWQTRGRAQSFDNFNTGDYLGTESGLKQTAKESASLGLKRNLGVNAKHLEGAGAYLRHLVTDDALNAYRKSTETDKTPLFQYVWHSSFYQNKIVKDEQYLADLQTLRDANGATRQAISDLKKTYAQDWADTLWQQYRAVDYAGEIKGVPNALEQASQVAIQHAGVKVDAALGKWIKDNQLAFDVRSAPVKGTQFDSFSQQWIGKLMTFNKLNRKVMFDHVFYDAYANFIRAGWEKGDAVSAATGIAKSQTIYHMLDFSNMLQVEQKFRWVSYYATKHRLYWTWIAKQFATKPGLAAAVGDVGQLLDPSGNLDFTLMGHRLSVPVARLFWVNNTEYPQTSALVETAARTGKNVVQGQQPVSALANAFSAEVATQGNVIGRDDQAIALATKYVGFLAGAAPATYGFAVKGLSPTQLAAFNDHMHGFITAYRADHAGAYPSEADAVKAAALSTALSEGYRSNLFLPVLYQTSRPAPIVKLITEFSNLHDPKTRADFLSKHPQIEDYFGASSDQGLWLHEQPLWDKFNEASKIRNEALNAVRLQMDAHGYSTQLAAEVKAISARYSQAIQAIRTQDAMTWKGDATYPAGRVSDNGEIGEAGPWSKKLDGNPLASQAFIHQAFPAVPHAALDAHTIGQTVIDLQNEETRIKQLGWQQLGYLDAQHAKDRVSQINQKLAVFRGMPRNPTTQMIDTYYKEFVTPYIALRTKLVAAQAKTSAADRNAVYAETRAIKETYDHPVVVTDPVTGKKVTFPSPVSFGFTMLPPDQYHAALAGAAASRWQDITGYEKNLLGVPTPPRVAEGWAAYERTLNEYASKNPGSSLVAVQKDGLAQQINKDYPGFLKDYRFAQQPKVARYEQTTLYKNMQPTIRSEFDRYIGGPAKQLAAAIKANGSANYYIGHWRNYVKSLQPWLADPAQKQLKSELDAYGPNFLNTLPSR